MKYIISFLLLFAQTAFAQEYDIRTDGLGSELQVLFKMVDATDGYTAETGLSPTCVIKKPLSTSYASSVNSPAEVGNGRYRITLNHTEIQDYGILSAYCTGTGSRPDEIRASIKGPQSMFNSDWAYPPSHSNYDNTNYWTKTGVTVSADSTADYRGRTIADTLTGDGASSRHKATYSFVDPGGSGEIYITAEVKSGTLNNAWIGNDSASHIWGVDLNTSTGVVTPNADGRLRGWKVEQLASSWWRIHLLGTERPTDSASHNLTIALNDGTGGDSPSTFTTSGTMIFTRALIMRSEDVSPKLLEAILPSVQSATSSTSVVLSASDSATNDTYNNREICFSPGYIAQSGGKSITECSCIADYVGSSKVATLSPPLAFAPTSAYKYKIGGVCNIENPNDFIKDDSGLNAPAWTKTGSTVTEDTTNTYDGFTIGDTVTGDGASTTHKVSTAVTQPGGSGLYYLTTEVKSGTLNNAWVGDCSFDTGIDLNTSTGVVTQSAGTYFRGYRIEKLASSWWRVHLLYNAGPTDATAFAPCVALGNGTATGEQTFSTSGTMIFARTHFMRAEDVSPALIETIAPHIQSSAGSTSAVLATHETAGTNILVNREICFKYGYVSSIHWKVYESCSCITSFDGTTKAVTFSPGVNGTLNSGFQYRIGGVCLNNPSTVGSVTGNVAGNVTGSVGSVTATTSANVVSMSANTITASAIATDAIGASEIASDAIGASEVADNAIDAGAIATDAIGATEIATDAITSAEISNTARQAQADTTLRRQTGNVEASSYGDTLDFRSLYGATAQQTHKNAVSSGVWTVYKDDNSTSLNARAVTGTSGANPITATD